MKSTEAQLREALQAVCREFEVLLNLGGLGNKALDSAKAALALPAQRPDDEGVWQDIAIEPKDGQRILLLQDGGPLGVKMIVGWRSDWFYRDEHSPIAGVTHWRPLPPSPGDAIRPYLRANPDAGLMEDARNIPQALLNAPMTNFSRQHTCAGAGKGVVDAVAQAYKALNSFTYMDKEGNIHMCTDIVPSIIAGYENNLKAGKRTYEAMDEVLQHQLIDRTITDIKSMQEYAALAQGKVSE